METFCLTTQKRSPLKIAGGWLCLVAGLLCLLISPGQIAFFIVSIAFFLGFYFLQIKGAIEYECSYFDGDIRFARVRAKSSRKALKHYNIDSVLQIAPAGDRSVYRYENDQKVKVFDYTSKVKGVPYYDMIIKDGETICLYKVELDDKYLDAVCIKNAYKVIRMPKKP